MSLNKAAGNMYDWEDFVGEFKGGVYTWNVLTGECLHKCKRYCFVERLKKASPMLNNKYSGPHNVVHKYLRDNLGKDRIIFVVALNDLFESTVSEVFIKLILKHCNKYPENLYLLQTKNPANALDYSYYFPPKTLLATTLECDEYPEMGISEAPPPRERAMALGRWGGHRTVTIEPVIRWQSLENFVEMIRIASPMFVSIGADSNLKCLECKKEFTYKDKTKWMCPRCRSWNVTNADDLPEPSKEEVEALIEALEGFTVVKPKSNLLRITG